MMYSHVLGSMRYIDTECGDALFSTHLKKENPRNKISYLTSACSLNIIKLEQKQHFTNIIF